LQAMCFNTNKLRFTLNYITFITLINFIKKSSLSFYSASPQERPDICMKSQQIKAKF